MNIKCAVTAIALIISPQLYAYERYSVFEDYVDQNSVIANNLRLNTFVKILKEKESIVGEYLYNEQNKVTQRKYLDSIFNYEYNPDGTVKVAKALMQPNNPDSHIKHTKQNFISEYEYKEINDKRVVSIERKKVFNDHVSNLEGLPEETYTIKYEYSDEGHLIKRIQKSDNRLDKFKLVYRYSYYSDGRLKRVKEIKKLSHTVLDRNTLKLDYYDNGEIKKATHEKQGNLVRVVELEYIDDGSLIYGVHYVDPIKEWKVDMDFFGLAFFPIKYLKETSGDNITQYEYNYQNTDGDRLPNALDVKLTLPSNLAIDLKYRFENSQF